MNPEKSITRPKSNDNAHVLTDAVNLNKKTALSIMSPHNGNVLPHAKNCRHSTDGKITNIRKCSILIAH